MGVFSRFVDIVNSNVNAALDSVEKPEHMLRMLVQEMEEALVEIRSHAAQHIAQRKVLERQITKLQAQASDWQEKAELALSKGREDLARQALVAKSNVTEELAALESEMEVVNQAINTVTEDASGLQKKLQEAKAKQKQVVKRQETAVVQLKARQVTSDERVREVAQRYERLQSKVDEMESKVEAYDTTAPVTLLDEFRQLENENKIQDELDALKKKVANA